MRLFASHLFNIKFVDKGFSQDRGGIVMMPLAVTGRDPIKAAALCAGIKEKRDRPVTDHRPHAVRPAAGQGDRRAPAIDNDGESDPRPESPRDQPRR